MLDDVQVFKKVVSSDAFKFHFLFWRILGVYPINGCSILYAVIITLSSSLPVGMTILLFFLDDLKDIMSNLAVNITAIAINLKFVNIMLRRQKILDVNDWVHQLDTRANSEEQQCLRSAVRRAHKMFYITLVLFTGTVILGELLALLSSGQRLMGPSWYPFDWRKSTWQFSIVHMHQAIVLLLYILQNVSNDTFPAVYIIILSSHVETLNIRIRSLGEKSSTSQDSVKELIQCIKDQQMLIRYFRTVQNATSPAIFLQFFVTGMEACVSAVCVFYVKSNLWEVIYFVEYFTCMILEVFLYCYFGNELVHESNRMTDAIYSCNWMDQDRKFKKMLVMFMQSTQKSMTIIAGGFFAVNLSAFVAVLKSSYSVFAVLMRMT